MNREQRRKYAKNINTPKKITDICMASTKQVREEFEREYSRRTQAFIDAYTTIVIYILWHKFGIGQKRMKIFSEAVTEYMDIIMQDKKYEVSIEDLRKELRENANINIRFYDERKIK